MKTIALIAVAAVGAFIAANAHAQSVVTGNVSVLGEVPQLCAVEPPALLSERPPVNFTGLTGTLLAIDRLTDPTTLATNAASVEVGFAALCNYPHAIKVQSQNNGLWRDIATPAASGFGNAIPYSATLIWGDVNSAVSADASFRGFRDLNVVVTRPTQGQIALRLNILPGASNAQSNAPLMAGIYRDTIRITVGPQ